jgi:hypothetical protein
MMSKNEFREAVESFCYRLGGSITSYGRTVRHNAAVKGVPQSAHQFWLAADIVYDDTVDQNLANDTAKRLGLRLIREDDHDHLQPVDWIAG